MPIGKPKLGTHDVFCINCGSTYPENKINLRHAGRGKDGRSYYNDECPDCGSFNSHVDVDGRTETELRQKQHEIARQRHEQRKKKMRATETIEQYCVDCGCTVEVQRRYQSNETVCDECDRQRTIDRLKTCLDPNSDETFSRAYALDRLQYEMGVELPIVDYNGDLITAVEIDHDPETRNKYIKSIEKIVDCDECGYERAEYSRFNHYVERGESFECPKCGHTDGFSTL